MRRSFASLSLTFCFGIAMAACDPPDTNDAGTSSPDGGTSSPDSGTSSPDGGTSSPDDGTSSPDDGTSSPDDGTSSPDGGGLPEPDDSTHSPGFWPPARYTDLLVRSGTRLTAQAVVSEEGNASLLYFDDAEFGERCTPQRISTGQWYCLPVQREGYDRWNFEGWKSDPSCTTDAIAISGATCEDGMMAVIGSRYPERVVRLRKVSGQVFTMSNGACVPADTALELGGWAVDEELSWDDFVEFSDHVIPVDDTLGVHVLRGEDGSRAATGVWLRDWDTAAIINTYYNAQGTEAVLRAVPGNLSYYSTRYLDRNYIAGPLVNLNCDEVRTCSSFAEPCAYGLLRPAEQAEPGNVLLFEDFVSGPRFERFHRVEGQASQYCSVPLAGTGPGGPIFDFNQATQVDAPAGYVLYRLGEGTAPADFPRVEQTIDNRAGGLRFEHLETVVRVPLLPVGTDLYQNGSRLDTFWADGALRGAVDSQQVNIFADGYCSQPLGNAEGIIYYLEPWLADACAMRGEDVSVYVGEAPEERSYTRRNSSNSCVAGNNGNPELVSPLRELTLPDPLVVDVPIEAR